MCLDTASYLLVGIQAADTLHEHLQLTIQCYTQSPTSGQCTLQLVPHMLNDHQPTLHLHPDKHLQGRRQCFWFGGAEVLFKVMKIELRKQL